MGHSVTLYGDKRIITKDYKIEIWLRNICNQIEAMDKVPKWLEEAQEYWAEHVENYVNGCLDPRFDEILTSEERKELFITLCQKVYRQINSFGDKIPKEYMNKLCGYEKPFEVMEDNKADIYLKYGNALISLLRNEQKDETEFI